MSSFQRNVFLPYRATIKIHVGKLERDIHPGEVIETDGFTVKFDSDSFSMPNVRTAIREAWFVPLDDTSGRTYVSKPSGVQMHSATPDRENNRATIPLQVAFEDHHVVGSVANASLGATSKRTREMQASAQNLQEQWNPQGQYQQQQYVPEMQTESTHMPLQGSDPRHATNLVGPNMSHQEVVHTMTGQEASRAAALPPTNKLGSDSSRRLITGTGAGTSAQSISAAAEQRAQQRQVASRQMASQKRAAQNMRGQYVGVNGLGAPGGPRHLGGSMNQQDPQFVRSVQQQAPAPPGAIPAQPSSADMAEYQEFLAFKQMKAAQAQQAQQAHQAALAQGHQQYVPAQHVAQAQQPQYAAPAPVQVQQPQYAAPVQQQATVQVQHTQAPGPPTAQPLSPVTWTAHTQGVHWKSRGKLAIETFGDNPTALQAIMGIDASKGVQNTIRKYLDMSNG